MSAYPYGGFQMPPSGAGSRSGSMPYSFGVSSEVASAATAMTMLSQDTREQTKERRSKKKAQCHICFNFFSDSGSLKKHVKSVHEKIRPYMCDECGVRFAEKSNLRKHMRARHSNEKRFVCERCGKRFTFNDGLLRHTRLVHEQQRNFGCQICGSRFKQKTHLEKHYRSHEKQKKKYGGYAQDGFSYDSGWYMGGPTK